jgi:hypothetical protein
MTGEKPLYPLHVIRHREQVREIYSCRRSLETDLEEWEPDSTDPEFSEAIVLDALLRPVHLRIDQLKGLQELELAGTTATESDLAAMKQYRLEGITDADYPDFVPNAGRKSARGWRNWFRRW